MKLSAVLLLATPMAGDAAGCACLATPANPQQTQAATKPTYPANAPAYGWGCKAHDSGTEQMFVVGWNGTACDGVTTAGTDNDWCEDQWCIVDASDCDKRHLKLSYTGATDDFFSYEACYSGDAFKGNGWVGRCQNCPTHLPGTAGLTNSYCACNGGKSDCPCVATPGPADPYSAQQQQAAGKPDYPEVNDTAYGWGCEAHDDGYDVCGTTSTADGDPNDWCKDQFCIVDPNKCTGNRNLLLTYTNEANDYFTYETCDVNFAGNGWVGRCLGSQTADANDMNESYYSCPSPSPTPPPNASPTPPPNASPTPPPNASPTPTTSPIPTADLASQKGMVGVGAVLLAAMAFQ